MTYLKRLTVAGIGLFFTTSLVFADAPSLNRRPRMSGMGNAGVGLLGDKDAAMMNPAGLSDLPDDGWELQAFPILIEVPFNVGLINSFLDYNDVRDSSSSTEAQKRDALEEFLGDVQSEAIGTRVNFNPSFSMKNIHLGIFADAQVNPRLRVGGATSNQLVEFGGSNITVGVMGAYSHSFLEDSLSAGITLKPIYRMNFADEENSSLYDVIVARNSGGDISDELLGTSQFDHKSFGFGVDLGVNYKVQWYGDPESEVAGWIDTLRPVVGVTWQDVGNTRFFGKTAGLPKDIDQSISAGLGVHPEIWILKTAFALDFRNIQEQQSLWNKIHFGAEAMLWDMLAFRVGMSQKGYITGGIGLNVPFFEMDIYVAAEEAGESAAIQARRTLGLRLAAAF